MNLLLAVIVAVSSRGVLVAQPNSIALYDKSANNLIWSADGVQTPARVVTSNDQAAVIDALANSVRIIDLRSGRGTTLSTSETPIDGVFVNHELYVLDRDASRIEHANHFLQLATDPAFLRESNGRLYVYSRTAGVLQEIVTNPFAISRSVAVPPFASDVEIADNVAYLVVPRAAKIAAISIRSMKPIREISVGAVPVDLAITSNTLAVADPSAKRVWMVEGEESFAHAFARGFLRGLLGLGLVPHNSDFPTGVDRVIVSRSRLYAYDSSTGTLYQSKKVIVKSVAPGAFSVDGGMVYVWVDAVRRLQRISAE